MSQNHTEDFFKYRCLGPTPRVSVSVYLEWSPRNAFPKEFPIVTYATDPGTKFWAHLSDLVIQQPMFDIWLYPFCSYKQLEFLLEKSEIPSFLTVSWVSPCSFLKLLSVVNGRQPTLISLYSCAPRMVNCSSHSNVAFHSRWPQVKS